MLGYYEGVYTSDTIGYALVPDSPKEIRLGERIQKALIFMRFHGVFLGSQHEF
jgi:hypothetical protein